MKIAICQLLLFSLVFQQLTLCAGRPRIMGNSDSVVKRVLQVAGSTLPDCSHACGSCTPCTRVIVGSSKCPIQPRRAEPCPVSYRCMCKGKSYPVP